MKIKIPRFFIELFLIFAKFMKYMATS